MTLVNCIVESVGGLLWHIAPAVVIVLGGSMLVQRFHVRRANLGVVADSIIGDLDSLQDDALKYWNTEPKNIDEADLLALRIKSSLRKITAKAYIIIDEYKTDSISLEYSLVELHDKVTGGCFESKGRKPDATQYFQITNAINSTMQKLLRTKI